MRVQRQLAMSRNKQADPAASIGKPAVDNSPHYDDDSDSDTNVPEAASNEANEEAASAEPVKKVVIVCPVLLEETGLFIIRTHSV
jgi:hypothetical protein